MILYFRLLNHVSRTPRQWLFFFPLVIYPPSTSHLPRASGWFWSITNRQRASLFTHNWMSMCALTGRQFACLMKQIWFWLIGSFAKNSGAEWLTHSTTLAALKLIHRFVSDIICPRRAVPNTFPSHASLSHFPKIWWKSTMTVWQHKQTKYISSHPTPNRSTEKPK